MAPPSTRVKSVAHKRKHNFKRHSDPFKVVYLIFYVLKIINFALFSYNRITVLKRIRRNLILVGVVLDLNSKVTFVCVCVSERKREKEGGGRRGWRRQREE